MQKETIIISLGGSLVAPNEIDTGFLKSLKVSLQKYFKDKRFFILVGGGKVCRNYQKAMLEFGANTTDRDWIGIFVTRLNAQVVCQLFGNYAHKEIIIDPNKKVKTNKSIVIGAGYKPGWSTDYVSVLIAKKHDVKTIINLTNIDYVCDKNPNEFPDAKPLKEIDWKSFEALVGPKWSPGLNAPFDPKASKLAAKLKLKVAMINGKDLSRLEDFLNNKPFIGTIIC
jgi:uridylate kinase